MIQCPKCGTLNQSGSRFCNDCGSPLVRTGMRCPECDAINPTGNVLCDQCGARLISPATELREQFDQSSEEQEIAPKAPIKGLSLPTIPLDEESDTPAEEPDWLAQLRGAVDEADAADEREDQWTAPDASAEPEDDVPDWLSDLGIERPPSPPMAEEPEPVASETDDWVESGDMPPSPQIPEDEPSAELPDWLQGIAPAYEESELEETEPPDWLQEETLQPGEQSLAFEEDTEDQEPPEPAEIPDWLSTLDVEQPPSAPLDEEEPEPAEIEEEDVYIPDWLGGRDQEPEEPVYYEDTLQPEELLEEEEEEEEDVYVPDWLDGMVDEEAPAYEPAPPAPEPEEAMEMPDRLGGMAEEEAPTYEPAPEPEEEAPDWLLGLETDEASSPASADVFHEEAEEQLSPELSDELPPPAEAEIPDWLREIEAEEPSATPESTDIPDWLAQPDAEAQPTPVFEAEESEAPLERGEIPDWLMKMRPDSTEPTGEPGAPVDQPPFPEGEGELAPAEIPDWLEAMRPSAAGPEKKEAVETEGVLEGLRGTLPSSPLVETTGKVEAAPSLATNAATVARAELLQELLGRPIAPELKEDEQVRKRETRWTVQHVLIMLLLLAAILTPLVADLLDFQLLVVDTPALEGNPLAAHNLIQTAIQPDDPVLVAFDYGPAQTDEMDNVASPMIVHLLNRQARLILVSSRPEGLVLSERLISDLERQGLITEEQAESQIVRLGYLPGRSMGVQSVLSDLTDFSVYWSGAFSQGVSLPAEVSSIEDFSLIVVLAGESADLQTWIEQTAIFDRPPMIAGLSARVAPLALPYIESAQLNGTVTGLVEAASYQAARNMENGRAVLQLQSLALAQLVVVGLIAVGAVIFMLRGNRT